MTHTITRTVKLNQPTQAYQITGRGRNKTAHEIPVSKALNDVRRLITLIHDEVQSRLTLTQAYEDKAKINDYQAWAKEIDTERDRGTTNQIVQVAIRAGLRVDPASLPDEISVKSRVSWLILGHYASKLKAWDCNPRHLPQAGWEVNLGYVNSSMTCITQNGKWVKLYLKAWDREIVFVYRKPSCSLRKGDKLGLPIINMNPITGRLSFNCPVQEKVPLPAITHDYVIGVDRGVCKYFTLAVIDTKTGKVVLSMDSTGVIEESHLKIQRQDDQVRGLHEAIDKALDRHDYHKVRELEVELDRVRQARSRLKVQLARDAARVILGVAEEFGNAVVCFEDLSWSGNWAGREPYGMLLHETEWLAEKRGLLCYTVPAAYSSQACSSCQAGSFDPVGHSFTGRVFHCWSCGFVGDRDVNAAVNLAARGLGRAVKSAVTRDRSKDCATPRRGRRGHVRTRVIIHDCSWLDSWLAGGGVARAGLRRSVPSGRGLDGSVALADRLGLAGDGVLSMVFRV